MCSGTGEHIDNLEMFEEKAFISKLLGMGDIQVFRFLFDLGLYIFSKNHFPLRPLFFYSLNWRKINGCLGKKYEKEWKKLPLMSNFSFFTPNHQKKFNPPPPLHMLHRLICWSKEVKLDYDGWRIEYNLNYSGFDG